MYCGHFVVYVTIYRSDMMMLRPSMLLLLPLMMIYGTIEIVEAYEYMRIWNSAQTTLAGLIWMNFQWKCFTSLQFSFISTDMRIKCANEWFYWNNHNRRIDALFTFNRIFRRELCLPNILAHRQTSREGKKKQRFITLHAVIFDIRLWSLVQKLYLSFRRCSNFALIWCYWSTNTVWVWMHFCWCIFGSFDEIHNRI